jgi:hypothetical protein
MSRAKKYSIASCAAVFLAAIGWIALRNMGCSFDPAEAGLHSIEMKLRAYQLDTGELPDSLNALLVSDGKAGWNGPYAREQDLLDPWHHPIHYEIVRSAKLCEVSPSGRKRSREIE